MSVTAPKLGAAADPAALLKANVGLAVVPKVEAEVVATGPKEKGAGFEAELEDTPPKVNAFGGSAVELRLD